MPDRIIFGSCIYVPCTSRFAFLSKFMMPRSRAKRGCVLFLVTAVFCSWFPSREISWNFKEMTKRINKFFLYLLSFHAYTLFMFWLWCFNELSEPSLQSVNKILCSTVVQFFCFSFVSCLLRKSVTSLHVLRDCTMRSGTCPAVQVQASGF